MNKEPEISVISACYNHGKFIGEMLESVLQQTFRNFEVIIVNDGSTDDTFEILQKINHEKVKIIHSSNQGPSVARNLAIENARAPLIMNLDADDKIAPDLLEKAYNVFSSHSDAGIVYCDVVCFGAMTGKFEIEDYSLENMLYDNRIISDAFFRKEDWRAVGGYSEKFIYGLEDWDFWLSLIELGKNVYKIPDKLVHYRTYSKYDQSRSGRRKADRMKSLKSLVFIFRQHKKLYQANPEAWKYFLNLGEKLENENFMLRKIRNFYFNHLRKIVTHE